MSVEITKREKMKINSAGVGLIKEMVASTTSGVTDTEFKMFMFLAQKYGLDPIAREIWCVKYKSGKPASIFAGRDGFLKIAHASGQFDGMESGIKIVNNEMYGWARVYRKDMVHPIYVECALREYISRDSPIWKTKPETMIKKVAESQALRKAFSIHGLYTPEEMSDNGEEIKNVTPNTASKTAITAKNDADDRVENGRMSCFQLIAEKGIIDSHLKSILELNFDTVGSINDLGYEELRTLYSILRAVPKKDISTFIAKELSEDIPSDPQAEKDIGIDKPNGKTLEATVKARYKELGADHLLLKVLENKCRLNNVDVDGVPEWKFALELASGGKGYQNIQEFI